MIALNFEAAPDRVKHDFDRFRRGDGVATTVRSKSISCKKLNSVEYFHCFLCSSANYFLFHEPRFLRLRFDYEEYDLMI